MCPVKLTLYFEFHLDFAVTFFFYFYWNLYLIKAVLKNRKGAW